jgi:predicted ATPase
VLAYLVAHAGQVVTKDALLQAIWPDMTVAEGVLKTYMGHIRHALGETARAPQYIVTVHRRGYRFMAPVTREEHIPAAPPADVRAPRSQAPPHLPHLMVGREAECAALHQRFLQAQQGTRQIVLVTGEAGIGKTTLVDAFVAQVETTVRVWSGRGQCIEHYGAGEAYLPLLEALGQVCRGPDGERLVALLAQQAPSWLLQCPALVPAADFAALQHRASGATRERMLRELAEAVEVMTTDRLLLLVLEDLHWSDVSTLDWLASVARRRQAARLLIVGTYRPVEAIVHRHPVRPMTQDLLLHGQGTELAIGYLSEAAVATYLARRFGGQPLPAGLARVVHQRTNGNPLFMVQVVDNLMQRGLLQQGASGWALPDGLEAVAVGVPESLQHLIEHQLARCSPEEQALLEAASMAGVEFSAAAVAAAVHQEVVDVEARCAVLARRHQFLKALGTVEWPDRTVAARYGFLHGLYQELLYERVPVSRRVQWHRHIGERLEAGYGARVREVAAELAAHFVRGRDAGRAVQYLHYAGEHAQQRSAHQEAQAHLTQALTLFPTLPATAERAARELQVHMALGPALMATKGFADPDVARTYRRARELCQQLGEPPDLFPALWGLWQFANGSAQIRTAQALGKQLLTMARRSHEPVLLVQAHHALWSTKLNAGTFLDAYAHTEHGRRLYTPAQHRAHVLHYGVDDPGVCCGISAAQLLWLLGYPDQAVQRGNAALALAQELGHPFSLAYTLADLASLHRLCRDVPSVQERGEAAMALGTAHGFAYAVTWGPLLRGWVLVMQGHSAEGITQVRQGFAAWQARQTAHLHPAFMVAEAYGKGGLLAEGLAVLAEALHLVETTGERKYEAELYRLKGELLWQASTRPEEAEACLQHALTVARGQQAKSWELRVATSLGRLWQRQGKCAEAYELLAPVYGWFTEGFDTADLREARALLETLPREAHARARSPGSVRAAARASPAVPGR